MWLALCFTPHPKKKRNVSVCFGAIHAFGSLIRYRSCDNSASYVNVNVMQLPSEIVVIDIIVLSLSLLFLVVLLLLLCCWLLCPSIHPYRYEEQKGVPYRGILMFVNAVKRAYLIWVWLNCCIRVLCTTHCAYSTFMIIITDTEWY